MMFELKILHVSSALPVQPEDSATIMRSLSDSLFFMSFTIFISFFAFFAIFIYAWYKLNKISLKKESELNSKIAESKSNFKDVFNDFSKLYLKKFFENDTQTFLFFDDVDFLVNFAAKSVLGSIISKRYDETPSPAIAVAHFSRSYSSLEDRLFSVPMSPHELSGKLNFECLNREINAEIDKGKAKVVHNERIVGMIDFNSGLAHLGERPVFKLSSSDSKEFWIEHMDKEFKARLAYALPYLYGVTAPPSYFHETLFLDKSRIGAHFLFSSISALETLNEDEKALLLSIALFIHVCFFFRAIVNYRRH